MPKQIYYFHKQSSVEDKNGRRKLDIFYILHFFK